MSQLNYPGVYTELVDSGFRPIAASSTSTVVFVGASENLADGSVHTLRSWGDYKKLLPDPPAEGSRVDPRGDDIGRALDAFFKNGGGKAYICIVTGGDDGYQAAFDTKVVHLADASIIVLPGQTWQDNENPEITAAVTFAARHGCMVLVDLPESLPEPPADISKPSSAHTATYHPWLKVGDTSVPPSAYVAAIWGRTDTRRGVWKAPAGVEARIAGISGLTKQIDTGRGGELNDQGINCLRTMPGYGTVIWGARTLSNTPEWRYISVHRTAQMIRRSIHDSIQWAVFEPNNARLWSTLRANIESFMNGLFRAEAFQGTTASQAYYVRCGLGDTMTQAEIDAGQVIVEVGFAPVKPAEFVTVKIQQIVNQ